MASSIAKNVSLSLGMINCVVRVESARYSDDYLSNACVNGHEAQAVKRPLMCETCGPILQHNTIKVRKMADGSLVKVDAGELQKADDSADFKGKISLVPYKTQDVLNSTAASGKLYWMEPSAAPENYALLAGLISRYQDKMFLARWTVRTKASLFAAQVKGSTILLAERSFEDALKPLPSFDTPANQSFVDLALSMVEQMDCTFNPDTFADTYNRGLNQLVNTKAGIAPENVTKDLLLKALVSYRAQQPVHADSN